MLASIVETRTSSIDANAIRERNQVERMRACFSQNVEFEASSIPSLAIDSRRIFSMRVRFSITTKTRQDRQATPT